MKNEEIYQELGITNASDSYKKQIISAISETVEATFVGIVDDMLDDTQAAELSDIVDQHKDDPAAIVTWLEGHIPKAAELYESIIRDHVAELKEQLAR